MGDRLSRSVRGTRVRVQALAWLPFSRCAFLFFWVLLSPLLLPPQSASAGPEASPSSSDNAVIYRPQASVEGRWSSKRSIYELDLLLPLHQSEDHLFFADLRGHLDKYDQREGNIGLGLRRIAKPGTGLFGEAYLWGVYGFYDQRRTRAGNNFSQTTLGVEWLSPTYDIRINGYFPEDKERRVSDSLDFAPGGMGIRSGYEKPMQGFDAEVGARIPQRFLPMKKGELRLFVGGYHFAESGYRDVEGPRARLAYSRMLNRPWIPEGTSMTLAAEVQDDDPRGTQSFARFKITIPFGPVTTHAPLSALQQRMTTPIERDVDVLSTGRDGFELADVVSLGIPEVIEIDGRTGDVNAALIEAGAGALIVASGSAGRIESSESVMLLEGQSLVGAGALLDVVGQESGRALTLAVPGTRPLFQGLSSDTNVIELASNTTLQSIDVRGGLRGVSGLSISNPTLIDVKISDAERTGVYLGNVTGATLQNVRVTDAAAFGIYVYESTGTSMGDVTSTSFDTGMFLFLSDIADHGGIEVHGDIQDLNAIGSSFLAP